MKEVKWTAYGTWEKTLAEAVVKRSGGRLDARYRLRGRPGPPRSKPSQWTAKGWDTPGAISVCRPAGGRPDTP